MSKRVFLLLAGLALAGSIAFGQVTNARIVGTITDTDGNVLPGVAVEATSPKLVGKATTISDENGVFRLLNLMPGTYKIKYVLDGFQTLVRDNISVSLEQTITLNVTMELGQARRVRHGHGPGAAHRHQVHVQGPDPDQGHVRRPAQGPRFRLAGDGPPGRRHGGLLRRRRPGKEPRRGPAASRSTAPRPRRTSISSTG